jgi:hypothetical protein
VPGPVAPPGDVGHSAERDRQDVGESAEDQHRGGHVGSRPAGRSEPGDQSELSGHRITFWQFTRYGALVTLITVALAVPYPWLRYFVLG